MNSTDAQLITSLIRDVPDFPSPGILFKDITPLLRDAAGFAATVKAFSEVSTNYDIVAGVEARGFIFASAVAQFTGKGFVPIRKAGKLPAAAHSESYSLEYGVNEIQIHEDAIRAGERVLLIDAVLATGGTLAAAAKLVERCGGSVDSVAVLMEIAGLNGQANFHSTFPATDVHILL